MPPLGAPPHVEGECHDHEHEAQRQERGDLEDQVLHDRVVQRMKGTQELRRETTLPDLEFELERVPGNAEVVHERQRDVVRGEVAGGVAADAASLSRGDRRPRREEDDRPDDREQHPEQRLDAVLRRSLDLRDEQLAIDPDHAVASASGRSSENTLSMTSSIGGSSTLMSASWSPSSRTRRAVRSPACARGTWIVATLSLLDTTSPNAARSPTSPRNVTVMRLYGAIRSARSASAPSYRSTPRWITMTRRQSATTSSM